MPHRPFSQVVDQDILERPTPPFDRAPSESSRVVEPSLPDIDGPRPHFLTSILPSDAYLTGISLLLNVIAETSVRVTPDRFRIAYLSLLSPYSSI